MKKKEKTNHKMLKQNARNMKAIISKPTKSLKQVNPGVILLLILIGIGVIALTFVLLLSGSQESNMTNSEILPKLNKAQFSQSAKNFTLMDTLGNIHNLSDQSGRPVLLDFTASWCGWCKKQTPAVQKLHNRYGSDVQFFSIDVNEPLETVLEFKLEEGSKWPFLIDENGEVAALYGIKGYPHYILLDKDGLPYKNQSGYSETFFDDFSNAIKQIIR